MATKVPETFKIPEYKKCLEDVFGLEIDRILEDGYPSKVMLAYHAHDKKRQKAIKYYLRDESTEGIAATRHFKMEAKILSLIRHPHIMTMDFYGSFPTYHAIVMPYYEEGTMTAVLQEMHEGLIDHYWVQICAAVKYLHDNCIVHRDIKTDNVLITNRNNIILTDFGLSCIVRKGSSLVDGHKGTPGFTSPEMELMKPYDGFKADMFSMGVVLWCMHFRQDIMEQRPKASYMYYVQRSKKLKKIDRNFLINLLEPNPSARWSIYKMIDSLTDPRRFVHRVEKLKGQS
ncbi:uncharacterized protein LOC131928418 [Physella acuta]|uniref:uncharacterized protein LOC131928418 n=1 Tax=Physella acuta TaxID=109671 RepID=UPI0027DBD093|nr:uncharacterized protein LOC131928418 [Physella acuta]